MTVYCHICIQIESCTPDLLIILKKFNQIVEPLNSSHSINEIKFPNASPVRNSGSMFNLIIRQNFKQEFNLTEITRKFAAYSGSCLFNNVHIKIKLGSGNTKDAMQPSQQM